MAQIMTFFLSGRFIRIICTAPCCSIKNVGGHISLTLAPDVTPKTEPCRQRQGLPLPMMQSLSAAISPSKSSAKNRHSASNTHQIGASGHPREHPEIWRGPSQRIVHSTFAELLLGIADGIFQIVERLFQIEGRAAVRFAVHRSDYNDNTIEFADITQDMLAVTERKLAGDEVDGLDAVGVLIDLGNAGIVQNRRRAGLIYEAHAAVNLHAELDDIETDISRKCLLQQRQKISSVLPVRLVCACRHMRHVYDMAHE